MRAFSVITIGVLLTSAGQLCAQLADPFESGADPFDGSADAARRVVPADSKPVPRPGTPASKDAVRQAASQPAALYPHVLVGRDTAANERIENALNRETTFDYLDQPLKDVIDDIAYCNDIPILLDTQALEDFGIDTGTPITTSLKGISLRSALRLMLRELELTVVIRHEVLQITTPEAAASAPSTRFYHVAELLPPDGDGEVLVELIKNLVTPNTWCGADGVGAIIYVEHLESLAIRQTHEVFWEIEELLATTKKLAEIQPPIVGGMFVE